MKKLIIALVLAILVIVVGSIILKNNLNIVNQNNEDVSKEKFEIIEQTLINEDSSIAEIKKIDYRYIMIKMLETVQINEIEPTENKEHIYLFDLKENKFVNQNVSLEGNSQYAGKNNNSIYMFLVKRSRPKIDLVEISFPNLKIINTISLDSIENIKNIIVAKENNKLAYSTQEGLFICDKDLNNSKLLLKSNSNEIQDIMDLKICVPIEFVDNDSKIIYKSIGYEWSNGIGVIDINTVDDNYYKKMDTELLKYIAPNNIYTKDVYTGVPINKYILSKKAEETVLNLENKRCVAINISDNNDKIAFVEEIVEGEDRKVEYNIYDINTKQIISNNLEKLGLYNSVMDIFFINNDKQILIIKSDEIKIWNY